MTECWNAVVSKRPSFPTLKRTFGRLLSDKMEYIPVCNDDGYDHLDQILSSNVRKLVKINYLYLATIDTS